MAEHHDLMRPEFGFAPPRYGYRSPFESALRAAEAADQQRAVHERLIAHRALAGELPDDIARKAYEKAVANQAYARAVYDVEAAKVRAA